MNFGYLINDGSVSESYVNTSIHETMSQIGKLYALTGSAYFKEQLDNLKTFVNSLPEDKCIAWGINKKQFDVEPTPIPQDTLYGLLQAVPDSKKDKEAMFPEYTVRVFRDLDQARRTEAASIVQFRNTIGKTTHSDITTYHPTLYRIKFEPIDDC